MSTVKPCFNEPPFKEVLDITKWISQPHLSYSKGKNLDLTNASSSAPWQFAKPTFHCTSVCWELTCDVLVSHPGGVKDSHLLNTTEIRDKRRLDPWAAWLVKDLASQRVSKCPFKQHDKTKCTFSRKFLYYLANFQSKLKKVLKQKGISIQIVFDDFISYYYRNKNSLKAVADSNFAWRFNNGSPLNLTAIFV